MLTMKMRESRQLVLFPFMVEGHVIPFVTLARRLEQRSRCKVTLVSTAPIVQKLETLLPADSAITLAELPFAGSNHGLKLLEESETLRPAFKNFISGLCLTAGRDSLHIIADFLVAWAVDVAGELGVATSIFITSGAYGTAVGVALWLHPQDWDSESEQEIPVPGFPRQLRISRAQLPDYLKLREGDYVLCRFLERQSALCLRAGGFLFNTVEGLEDDGLEYFARKSGRPVFPIGPIVSATDQGRFGRTHGIDVPKCVEWLNLHPPLSVLYIAFGSADTISATQMLDFAAGLESSGKPFIWVIKAPLGYEGNEEFSPEWLPVGFEKRMREGGRGLVVRNWAPQLAILSHRSTGAFLSHCGWNSALESLAQGVPIISWPLSGEQSFNAKMLVEEAGVSVPIAAGDRSKIEPARVKAVIDMVMGKTEKGEEMRRNARKIKEKMEAAVKAEGNMVGSSIRGLDSFLRTAFIQRETRVEGIVSENEKSLDVE